MIIQKLKSIMQLKVPDSTNGTCLNFIKEWGRSLGRSITAGNEVEGCTKHQSIWATVTLLSAEEAV